jgi:sugar phosphate isomerase/epimerase
VKLHLGVKSDPIENRYSYTWLFDLMREHGIDSLQLGSSFPMFYADDAYFTCLRGEAERRGVLIDSIFTSHRELGGFSSGDPLLEAATRRGWERIIKVAALLGARSAGSNAGIILRDQPGLREPGIRRFFDAIKGLLRTAKSAGLSALTIEPMSSLWEYPSTPDEVRQLAMELEGFVRERRDTVVPLLLCGDISHGVADADGGVLHDNWSLFEMQIPWMWEFHIKNTDAIFNSTFGFGPADRRRGIVDLVRLKKMIDTNATRFPAREVTGYLEIGGPKTGREYTDRHLEGMLVESLEALKTVFREEENAS